MIRLSDKLDIRGYNSAADRQRAVTMLKKKGYTHFTFYNDVKSFYALMYAKVKIY